MADPELRMRAELRTADFDFALPPELIAQQPVPERDQSRLLVLERASNERRHGTFRDLVGYLNEGDTLVLNNSRVIPARLRGSNPKTGGQFEVFLVEENAPNDWWALLRPGKRGRIGTQIALRTRTGQPSGIIATVVEVNDEGHRRLQFAGVDNVRDTLVTLGEVPLPPYINRGVGSDSGKDFERYQTVYAEHAGSVAAPTAGLHFTVALLEELRSRKINTCFVTLHVGLGTFAPVKVEDLGTHNMHEEMYEVTSACAETIRATKEAGKRIIAVGTTSVRVLESIAAEHHGALVSGRGRTRIFIYPPYDFKMVDGLLTNFHLPRSTLLMLVSAFASPKRTDGRAMVLDAYAEAIREKYRFFSYGDAMLLL